MAIMISSNLRMLRSNSKYTLEDVAEIVGVFSGYVPVKLGPSGKLLVIDLVFQK